MDLVSGKLLWPELTEYPTGYPRLDEDIHCDVLIIGGGQTGALCSYYLHKQGVDTVVVDKHKIGGASTSANTGMLQFSNDKTLTRCINTFGETEGVRFYTLCKQAVDELERLSTELEHQPDFIRRSSLYLASTERDVPALRNEFALLQKYGFPVSYWERDKIGDHFSFQKPGAIYSSGNAEINPYKLTCGLISLASRNGVRVFEGTEIQRHIAQNDQLIFYTKDRRTITARYAVIATGYETQRMKRNHNAVLKSSFAIATGPIEDFKGWYERCLLWETARPYLYIRTTADNRIIAGGMDESSHDAKERDVMLCHKRDLLLQELKKLFPQIPGLSANYFWSGMFVGTHDGYPLFGLQENFPSNCFFALPYGGNGSVYSTLAAQIVTTLILKGSHPDAHMFRFDRPRREPGYDNNSSKRNFL